jgi:GTPase SAR1 family protein
MPDQNSQEDAKRIIERFKTERGKNFTFLLIGRTGVGKSSTVNSLMGQEIAPVGDYRPTTMSVESYESEIGGVKFTIIDTPGLCDDLEEKGNDYDYLEQIRLNVDRIDLMWFVTELDDNRVRGDERRGIKLISEIFGSKIWEQAIIVFTCELIREQISKYAGVSISNNVPSVGVSNLQECTPDGERWLGELYIQVYTRMAREGAGAFFMSTVERIQAPKVEVEKIVYVPTPSSEPVRQPVSNTYSPIYLNERQAEVVRNRTAEVIGITVTGALVGAAVGSAAGPVGAVIGGAIGAAWGFFRSIGR